MAGAELAVWALRNNMPLKEVARLAGVTAQAVSCWRWDRAKPNARHRVFIEQLTGGAVPVPMWDAEPSKAT